MMALNKQVYDDIPHVHKKGPKPTPQPHPYKAHHPHEFWFIDGRMMDFALEGVRWWSLIILDGYSRMMLAGAVAPAETSWSALMVLYTACLHDGAPETLISDGGGAYTSKAFEAVLTRLQICHEIIESTKGESYLNWMETHFNIQRRLYDYQFSLTTTPAAFEQAHQAFMATYNTTAHQGLLKDQFDPPIPLKVLGRSKGEPIALRNSAVSFRTTSFLARRIRDGCVTLHRYHFYVEQGLPTTPVLLWLSGDQLRAVFNNVVVAEYRCQYDWHTRQVKDIRDGVFHPTRYTSSQGALIPFNPREFRCSIARSLGDVTRVRPYPLSNYLCLNARLQHKVSLASHMCNGNFGEVCGGHMELSRRLTTSPSTPKRLFFEDWNADAYVRALFDRRWGTRGSRCGARYPRDCSQVLHRGRQLGHRRKQYASLFFPRSATLL